MVEVFHPHIKSQHNIMYCLVYIMLMIECAPLLSKVNMHHLWM